MVQPPAPGPLEARPDPSAPEPGLWKVVIASRPNICTAQMCTEGDATLYAAAPDLLKALSGYACDCPDGECAMSADGDATPVSDSLCGRRAREAVAKARAR